MANGMIYKSLAVLIDADNAQPSAVGAIFDESAKFGEVNLRRIYGDFSGTRLKGWTDLLAKHAILPQQQFAYTKGKNSSDIALVIDAMDLMHTGRFGGFCLVSSDSDFTRLAARLREQGADVFGFGEQKTPESFRQACTRFIFTENLIKPEPNGAQIADHSLPFAKAIPLIRKAMDEIEDDAEGWDNLSPVGVRLYALYPDFDPRSYGRAKLVDLVYATGAFDIDRPQAGGVRIRLKQVKK